ncbi:hypothetical protein [Nonomuraea basaltis]|uniref:hypothetical protein n=1 Tax=Nonomuraea basaltis TaxID=2495887 RepID=UPI00110C61AB|nr:hypothetical protein [Nonomuraea basaltis]TMR89698.1 hypothetical protein EJK15_59370 [Nonomuraea basaltis]
MPNNGVIDLPNPLGLVPDQLVDLFRTVKNAFLALGSDEDERQLHIMSLANKQLAADLQTVGTDHIDPAVKRGRNQWTGRAAETYDFKVEKYLSPAQRADLIANLGNVANGLVIAQQVSHQTKNAFRELLISLAQGAAICVGLSMMTAAVGRLSALQLAQRLTLQGASTAAMIWNRLLLVMVRLASLMAKAMNQITKIKGLRWLKRENFALVAGKDLSFGKATLQGMRSFGKMFAINYAGQYTSVGLGNVLIKGENFFSPFGLKDAQIVKTSAFSAGFPWGSVGWANLKNSLGWKAYFVPGFLAGGGSTAYNDIIEGKSLGQTAFDVAKMGTINGAWGAFSGWGAGAMNLQSNAAQQAVSSFGALIPATPVRAAPQPWGVPYAPSPEMPQVNGTAGVLPGLNSPLDSGLDQDK